jgi:ABC-2 type transport system ATP-binding protein
LSKHYGKERGISNLNLEVYAAETFGFLGLNGAGKTTTIRSILNLIKPSSGSAEILGLDAIADSIEIRKNIGYLPGELELFNEMTGKDFLAFMANLRGGVDWSYVEELISNLSAQVTKPIKSLSHGNKQKLGLIQAFMHEPDVLIFDEPTNGLDPLVQEEFHKILKTFKKNNKTIFLSSHVMSEVEEICDRVGIIREGKLIAIEKVEDLKAKKLQSIEIHFTSKVPEGIFENLTNVSHIEIKDNIAKVKVSGTNNIDSFIKTIANYEVTKIIAPEPNLEEIFLSYFKGDEDE